MMQSQKKLSFPEFTRLVVDALEAAQIDYMIGGSVALAAWAEPRTTVDIDLVINLPYEQVYALSQQLIQREMLVPFDVLLDLLLQEEGDQPVHAIHVTTGFKAELFLLRPSDSFRATALSHRLLVDLGEPLGQVYVQSPEDLIIYKVRYYQISNQTKHVRDIQSILTVMRDELDFAYIQHWINHFNLSSAWNEVQNLPNPG
jgi:hypothetical protein